MKDSAPMMSEGRYPKVLLITNYKKGTGGISGQVELLQKNLRKEEISADIFNTKGSVLFRLFCKRRLAKMAVDYDVLHIRCCSNVGFFPAVVGVAAGRKLGKKVIMVEGRKSSLGNTQGWLGVICLKQM